MLPQLRVRTEYSFRSCYGPVERVASRLADVGCRTAGIVDTHGTWGHVPFEKALLDYGIQPLFGAEFTMPKADGTKPRCWTLAQDLGQFYRLSSANPQTPAEMAEALGVIRFAGAALDDPECFDYIDINPRSRTRTRQAVDLAKRTGKPLVLTSDNDYPALEDRERFLAWDDSKKMTPQHIMSDDEFRWAFSMLDDDEFKAAWRNTMELEERLAAPSLKAAPMIQYEGDLRALVDEGKAMRVRKGQIAEWTDEYQQRLEREMAMIEHKDYGSYFLVVADLVKWAKEEMLVGPARGSSAGSLVCFLLEITEVDPLVHGLIFERFIDANRADLPDIDIDFSDRQRHKVADYLAQTYGKDNVAKIGSVNRLKPRSVVAHVGKKLGIPQGATFPVLNVLIEYSSGDSRFGKGLEDTLETTQPGQDFKRRYPEGELMAEIEEHASHTGVHAAGIIVANVPVTEYCTVRDGIAQIDKKDAEYLNLLKIDALGLRTLGVIEDAGCVEADDLYRMSFDDPEVLKIFDEHKFSGVFQFEGAAQRRVSIQVPVDDFKKIDHVTALARPGPLGGGAADHYTFRNAGREEITYRHPSMEEYLGETMGVVLYQEQVMRIVRELGDFSWEETSVIRKAMSGRKGKEFFDQRGEAFVAGAAKKGIDAETAQAIWEEICNFGAWGMNKCAKSTTCVKVCHPNQTLGKDPTLEQLYDFYKRNPSDWVRQRNVMPKLLSVGADGVARPTMAVDIHETGTKQCVKLTFDDDREVECTEDHKFVINGEWRRCGDATIGDEFETSERLSRIKNHAFSTENGRGWERDEGAVLTAITDIGEHQTYDIEMPAPNHNYVLANGIVTHNSHTTSYAMISYWCAYMKRYHPLEYAAACLRNAKDDEQTIEILRELAAEGVQFEPFDADLSDANWTAKEGRLLGGYSNLVGIGPIKAQYYVQKRDSQGLDQKDRDKLAKHKPRHEDLREAHTLWGHIYDNPAAHNIHGVVSQFGELEDRENAVVIAKLVKKTRRDRNETVLVNKRGYREDGQTLFLDMAVVDDSQSKPVTARINKQRWGDLGEPVADKAVDGQDWFLLRGFWLADFSMFIVKKIKCLTNSEVTRAT